MSATATTAFKSPSHSHTHSHSHSKTHSQSHSHSHSRSRSRVSTTPRPQPSVASVGQSMPPLLTPNVVPYPSQHSKDPKSPSPSYFGFVVGNDDTIPPDSNPGNHARQNWNLPTHSSHSAMAPSRHAAAVESHPEFEAFRRQSEHNHRFTLNSSMSSLVRPSSSRTTSSSTQVESPASPLSKRPMLERNKTSREVSVQQDTRMGEASFFDVPRRQSPAMMTHTHSVADHQHARLSLPMSGALTPPSFNLNRQTPRSDTLPPSSDKDSQPIVSPTQIRDLLQSNAKNMLVLDLRVYQQFATSRVRGALNLCIPTTLLKRPAYNVQRLADTFSSGADQETFARWKQCSHIVVYDANSNLAKEALTPLNVLKKFTTEGWKGTGLVIKGGFAAFSKMIPDWVESGPVQSGTGASTQPLSISAGKDTLAVAGGCTMPAEKSAANPFFGNIRQNTDLLDGVGQMPIQMPNDMTQSAERHLPKWLQHASAKKDEGKAVSERFLKIEKHEQKRMQDALNVQVSYGTPRPDRAKHIQIAGIEKGSKNRYNNIFPYDHTRVKLQDVPQGTCDYINANHVKAQFCNRQYIATQAPIPATFNDFWRVVWEQDVRVIVMLTAESEGGQVKSHNYWTPGQYGPFKLKELSERTVSLEPKKATTKASQTPPNGRPSLGPRRSTTASVSTSTSSTGAKSPSSKPSTITVRHFAVSHSTQPFQAMREVTQIQYADWPDFGAPASPMDILGLVEQVNKYIGASSPSERSSSTATAPEGQRPVLVHCSAGCGRTGTFCTIDSVIDMLKRQKLSRNDHSSDRMDVDGGQDWVSRDDVDLVAQTVDDFRHQRLSMVQNLRQFVLCYESVLQWLAGQEGSSPGEKQKRPGIQDSRRSYHG